MNEELTALRARLERAESELESLKLTLEVVGTVDLDTGVLNRTGVLDGLERGRRWMSRRGDIYGMLVVAFPRVHVDQDADRLIELAKHITASIGAGVRDVDDVGRLDDHTYAAVLADLKPGSIEIVADRVRSLIARLVDFTPDTGGVFKVGAVEVLSTSHTPGVVFDAALRMADSAAEGASSVGQI